METAKGIIVNFKYIVCVLLFASCKMNDKVISLESLLDEMVSIEESARFPEPYYKCMQESSYDRLSVSPDSANWFANADGFGIVRIDTIEGRTEKVMFDQKGPGVITRIWITTIDKRGVWRFYFDGSENANWVIPAYDLMKFGIPELERGLLQPHTSYTPDGKGGSTLFLPIPYAKNCKITFEDEAGVAATPKYYQINYRKYPEGTKIETFTKEVVARAKEKIIETDSLLLNPPDFETDTTIDLSKNLASGDSLIINLPVGENAVYKLRFDFDIEDTAQYAQVMRELIIQANFDQKQTVWVPISDFSGGGMGAPSVKSWFLSANGKGSLISRWLMPYKERGEITLHNASSSDVKVSARIDVSPLKWGNRSLYFHASWKQDAGVPVYHDPSDDKNCSEWDFATIQGKGVYKGDVLTLFNHSPAWYGEGDEKIWVDTDTFPSHFGTGTEDYYNSSWAPVIPFQTPFGGAPRADLESSHGYNTFFRTRNLDGIPFFKNLDFNIEMISWIEGVVDYSTTVYWYGDFDAQALNTSKMEGVAYRLPPPPENPANYVFNDCVEFEDMKVLQKSESIVLEKQAMYGFLNGRWSGAKQLLCTGGQPGDFIEFIIQGLDTQPYELTLHGTKATDYGIFTIKINDESSKIIYDGFAPKVINSGMIHVGKHWPQNGQIRIRIDILGTNDKSQGARYLIGLDCIQLITSKS